MIYHVTIGDRTLVVEIDGASVSVDGTPRTIAFEHLDGSPVRSLVLDGASHRVSATQEGPESWEIDVGARTVRAEVVDERTKAIRAMTGRGAGTRGPSPVVAPMPGMVVRVEVTEGDEVAAGQGIVIVEAMKMENELVAQGPGVVRRVLVREGEAVEKDQLLVDLDPPPAPEEEDR